jgi:heme exporter protein D
MTKKIAILVMVWLVFSLADYFYLPYFVQPFCWLLVCITLLILLVRQIINAIKERKNLKTTRILNLSITLTLFFLTFYNFNKIPNSVIEKFDWTISYNKRQQIVKQVLTDQLKPNTEMNNGICKLSFDFPIISNGGNDIWIYENKKESTKAIKFWISRGFFDSPQTYFIFTNDNETKKHYQEQIKTRPQYNWKLEENWYRIMERD